jgi:thiamine-phosphate pyrophosphorylase
VCSSSAELARRLRLVLITPGDRPPEATQRLVELALAGGVTAVLLREPQLGQDERNFLAQALAEAAHDAGALFLVHNDTGAALECAADGVHLGWGGPEPAAARTAAPGLIVGRSAHWPLQAQDRAADYLLLSPFRATPKAHPRPLLSAEQVRSVLAEPGLGPIVALGGLDAAELGALPEGLAGVAVLRAIGQADDPAAAATELRAAVERRWPVPA